MTNNNINQSALLTDLYQLKMMQCYFDSGMKDNAVFEFFVRKLPDARNFFIAAGLEQILDYLQNLKFTTAEIDYLANQGCFKDAFLDYLKNFKFTGDINAMPEGTIFFPNEPILQVIAPLIEGQFIESRLINLLHFQTLIASKAIRSKLSADHKSLIDFGMRRAHGAEAAIFAARASSLVGFDGTATVLAGQLYSIPIYGTMAHSFIQAHKNEKIAFESFAKSFPDNIVLLLDTYNITQATNILIELAAELRKQSITIKAVRIDSGDLDQHAREVRELLDHHNLQEIKIMVSGDIDEYRISELVSKQSPIDIFGVGTRLDTSCDAPYLDCAYKLQEYAGLPSRKKSEGKVSLPGRKQVYRYLRNNIIDYDVIALADENMKGGQPLLHPVMRQGVQVKPNPLLVEIRNNVERGLETLPAKFKTLMPVKDFSVKISNKLEKLISEM